jgi:hypothetical protein
MENSQIAGFAGSQAVPAPDRGSEECKALGSGLPHEQRKEVVLGTEFIKSGFLHLCAEDCITAKF